MNSKTKYKIIDKFLEKDTYNNFSNFLKSEDVPWYYRAIDSSMGKSKNKNGFFSFCFYNKFAPNHNAFYTHMQPFIKKLSMKSILQIRANLTCRDVDNNESSYHVDYLYDNSTTGLYFLTTCNAKTILKIGKKEIPIDNIENRMLLFPTNVFHKVVYQTDIHRRYVINFNFFE